MWLIQRKASKPCLELKFKPKSIRENGKKKEKSSFEVQNQPESMKKIQHEGRNLTMEISKINERRRARVDYYIRTRSP